MHPRLIPLLRSLGVCALCMESVAGTRAMAEVAAPQAAEAEAAEVAEEKPAKVAPKAAAVVREVEQAFEGLFRQPPEALIVLEQPVEVAQVDALMTEIRPMLTTEVSFAKRACDMSPAELKAAIAAAKSAAKKFAAKHLGANGQLREGLVQFNNGRQRANSKADSATALQNAVVDAIKKTLPPPKRTLYEAEVAHRQEFRRLAAADNLAAIIDERLYLTTKQRTGVTTSLREAAAEDALPPLDHLAHGGNYLPQFPDQAVAAHLDKNQQRRWNLIPKVHFQSSLSGNHQLMDSSQVIDDVDLGDELP